MYVDSTLKDYRNRQFSFQVELIRTLWSRRGCYVSLVTVERHKALGGGRWRCGSLQHLRSPLDTMTPPLYPLYTDVAESFGEFLVVPNIPWMLRLFVNGI